MNQFEQSNAMWDLCIDSVICATCANRTINMESWNGLKIVFDISKLAPTMARCIRRSIC